MVLFDLLDHLGNFLESFRRCGSILEESTQLLLLFFVVRRIPGDVCRVSFEEIRYEHLVRSIFVTISENVGALDRLWEESEDIVDHQNRTLSVRRSGNI